jgi:hypothetical protein
MLGAQGLCTGRDLYRATPAVTRGLGFSGLIRKTAPFSRLIRHTRGCGGSFLTRILTGLRERLKYKENEQLRNKTERVLRKTDTKKETGGSTTEREIEKEGK